MIAQHLAESLIRVERSLGAVSHYDVRCPPELVDVIVELAKGAGCGHVDSYQQRDTKEYSRNGQNRTPLSHQWLADLLRDSPVPHLDKTIRSLSHDWIVSYHHDRRTLLLSHTVH